jgi:hypothetical protein
MPLVRASDPEETVADERFSLDEADNEESPGDDHKGGEKTDQAAEETAIKSLMNPNAGLYDHEGNKEGEGKKDFGPVMASVLARCGEFGS